MAKVENLFETVKNNLDLIAPLLSTEYSDKKRFNNIIRRFKKPQDVLKKKLVVKLANGKKKTFQSFRIQHNDARGPFVGGTRYTPNLNEEELKGFAVLESIKTSAFDIPFGGGYGGVVIDRNKIPKRDLERITKLYSQFLAPHIGMWKDIISTNVGTNEETMAWMLESYEKKRKFHSPATFSGKPLVLGGSLGAIEAVGVGAFYILQEYLKHSNLVSRFRKLEIAISGFGKNGYNFAKIAVNQGFKIVAVTDSSGGVVKSDGLEVEELKSNKNKFGSLKEVSSMVGMEAIDDRDLLKLPVDILVVASSENNVTKEIAEKIEAKLVLQISDFGLKKEAEELLRAKNIEVLPDILLNTGGLISTHLEWVQNIHGYRWGKEDFNSKLRSALIRGFNEIRNVVLEKKISYRQASYYLGLKRIVEAMTLRGRV